MESLVLVSQIMLAPEMAADPSIIGTLLVRVMDRDRHTHARTRTSGNQITAQYDEVNTYPPSDSPKSPRLYERET